MDVPRHNVPNATLKNTTEDYPPALPRVSSSLGISLLSDASQLSDEGLSSFDDDEVPGIPLPVRFVTSAPHHHLGRANNGDYVFIPPHRPFVGGGAAAAFEALRHDYYVTKHEETLRHAAQRRRDLNNQASYVRASVSESSNSGSESGESIQQLEMLKVHQRNLMNEMQETSLMMNLFQQHRMQSTMQVVPGSPLTSPDSIVQRHAQFRMLHEQLLSQQHAIQSHRSSTGSDFKPRLDATHSRAKSFDQDVLTPKRSKFPDPVNRKRLMSLEPSEPSSKRKASETLDGHK